MNLNDEENEQLTAYRDAQLSQRRELSALRKVLEAARALEAAVELARAEAVRHHFPWAPTGLPHDEYEALRDAIRSVRSWRRRGT